MSVKCVECGRDESEHHVFVAPTLPVGCVCDPGEWTVRLVPPACAKFDPMKHEPALCRYCEHEEPCHAVTATPEAAR